MPRRTLLQNVKDGELSLKNAADIIGVSAPKMKQLVDKHKIKYRIPPFTKEIRICPISFLEFCETNDITYEPCLNAAASNRRRKDKRIAEANSLTEKPESHVIEFADKGKPAKPKKSKAAKTEEEHDPESLDDIPVTSEFS